MSDTSLSVPAALAFVDQLSSVGQGDFIPHDHNDPPEPSPIDPVIREALYQALNWGLLRQTGRSGWSLGRELSPLPEPWLLAALNPQPLPPLLVCLAAALVARAELIADASGPDVAASYVQRMIDDICPPPRVFKLPPRTGPWPPSEPRPIVALTVSASDLVVFAGALRSASRAIAYEPLAEAVRAGALTAAEYGVGEINAG